MLLNRIASLLRQKRVLVLAVLLTPLPVVAGLATTDLTGQTRAAPDATIGALEIETAGTAPSAPTGLSITVQR